MKRILLLAAALMIVVVGGMYLWPQQTVAQSAKERAAALTGLPIEINITSEPLSMRQSPSEPVRFVAGWALTSDHEDFGGFSGLVLEPENGSLVALNDKGDWWKVPFDAMQVVAPAGGTIQAHFMGAKSDKRKLDAESVVAHRDGYLISYEQIHRLSFQPELGGKPSKPEGFAEVNFTGMSKNGGMEAITILPTNDLLAFSERGLDTRGTLKAWLVSANGAQTLRFAPPKSFAPTDAATLPNGDVLVLLRKYSAVEGVAVKIHHVKAGDIRPGAIVSGAPILELTPSDPVDNMEGLDLVALDNSTVRIAMISDDNFNPLQRTLLMIFDYIYQ